MTFLWYLMVSYGNVVLSTKNGASFGHFQWFDRNLTASSASWRLVSLLFPLPGRWEKYALDDVPIHYLLRWFSHEIKTNKQTTSFLGIFHSHLRLPFKGSKGLLVCAIATYLKMLGTPQPFVHPLPHHDEKGGFLSHGDPPKNHPFEIGIFHCKSTIQRAWGTPMTINGLVSGTIWTGKAYI